MAYTPITPSDPLSTSVGDINTAFNLCSTMFASATAPGTIQAYSNWIDTSGTDVLKIRNAGNTAWVNIYQLGSQTGPVLSDGTDSITIQSPATIGTSYSLTLPADQGGANTFLKNNGSGVFSWSTVAGGVVDIGDLGDVTITAAATGEYLRYSSGAWVDSPLLITDLSVTSEARGDVIVRDASGFVRLGVGGSGQVLSSDGTDVVWSSSAAGLAFTTITPSSGASVVADSATDTLTLTGGTGITVTGTAATDTLEITSADGGINHNSLLNYDANKHPDITGSITVTGVWSFAKTVAGSTEFSVLGGGAHSLKISGDLIYDRGTNPSTLTAATLSAVRTWTLPDESGTITVQGNTTTGTGTTLVKNSNPTLVGATMSSILKLNTGIPARFYGTLNYVGIVAPTSSASSYTLTLPNSSELPSSGTYMLRVDSSGTLSFSAS
jgi:hypothetical protein